MENNKWEMPEWMEQYRHDFRNTGGNNIESLMNDKSTNAFNNVYRFAFIVCVEAQVNMLETLHKQGKLANEQPLENTAVSFEVKA